MGGIPSQALLQKREAPVDGGGETVAGASTKKRSASRRRGGYRRRRFYKIGKRPLDGWGGTPSTGASGIYLCTLRAKTQGPAAGHLPGGARWTYRTCEKTPCSLGV